MATLNFTIVPIDEVPFDDARLSSERHRPVIMIVDDESVVADSLATILSRAGFATLTAYDGRTALELARAVPPELLISDVAMPAMSGIELAISIVTATPECKVLLFSGHATSKDLAAARSRGYNFPLIAKPIHPAEMVKRVQACLRAGESIPAVQ